MSVLSSEIYLGSLDKMLRSIDLSFLCGRAILITGATGMLGSCLVDALARWNREQKEPCRIVAVSRNWERAKQRFAPIGEKNFFSYQALDVCDGTDGLPERVDYIIHAASNADPVSMARCSVETLTANVLGTKNLLDYGLSHGMKRFLFVSSGEIYGQSNGTDFTEDYCGPLDLSSPRSCYPEGKRAGEVLCQSYINQYNADTVIARPCHLFGPTMTEYDSRAVSEFLRKAAKGEDIQLKSAGTLERSHCYVVDAVSALLLVLRDGACRQAYNIADRRYQMTIREFAEQAAKAANCRVVYGQPSDTETKGYSKADRMVLDALRVERLGWEPMTSTAISDTINILRESR